MQKITRNTKSNLDGERFAPKSVDELTERWLGTKIDMDRNRWRTSGEFMKQSDADKFCREVKKWMKKTKTSWNRVSDESNLARDCLRNVLLRGTTMTYRIQYRLAHCIVENFSGIRSGRTYAPKAIVSRNNYVLKMSQEEIEARRDAVARARLNHESYWLEKERALYGIPPSQQRRLHEMPA